MRVSGNLVSSDVELLRLALIAGVGVAISSPFSYHEELRTGFLVPLLRNYQLPVLSFAAVYPHRRHLAAKVRVFIDALAKLFDGHDWLNPDWLNPEGAAPPR